ncbi:MAG TPA: zf-HC2 domain-containing protein [Longimicrobiales bacterium]
MNRYDCETIRDLLPSLTRGEMLPHEAVRLERHLAECVECAAQAEVVRLLQTMLAPVPPALEARVLHAVRHRSPRRRVPAARLALAATVAAAILGGALVLERRTGADAAASADVESVSWAAADDPLLHGGSALQQLTVDELEILLEELKR